MAVRAPCRGSAALAAQLHAGDGLALPGGEAVLHHIAEDGLAELTEGGVAVDRCHHLADLDIGNGCGVLRGFEHKRLLDGHEQLICTGRRGEAEGGGKGDEQCMESSPVMWGECAG